VDDDPGAGAEDGPDKQADEAVKAAADLHRILVSGAVGMAAERKVFAVAHGRIPFLAPAMRAEGTGFSGTKRDDIRRRQAVRPAVQVTTERGSELVSGLPVQG